MDRLSADPLTLPPETPRFVPTSQGMLGGGRPTGRIGEFGGATPPGGRISDNLIALEALRDVQRDGRITSVQQQALLQKS